MQCGPALRYMIDHNPWGTIRTINRIMLSIDRFDS